MRLTMRSAFMLILLLTACVSQAFAQDVKTFAVLPFEVNGPASYKHLERAIPQMLTSRLFWRGHFESIDKAKVSGVTAPADATAAQEIMNSVEADYLVYGSTTIIGEESSIDVRVVGKDGTSWPRSASSKVSQMIPTLKNLANAINSEVFKRPDARATAAQNADAPKTVNQMNPVIQHNQINQNQQVYLNPQFRYAGNNADDTRIRSNALSLAAFGMLAEDLDGDGKNEVALLTEHRIHVYDFVNSRLLEKGVYEAPLRLSLLTMRSIDMNRDGVKEIVVSAMQEDGRPSSFIVKYSGGAFSLVSENITYLLNVVKMPPDYIPTLIGQEPSKGVSLWRNAVYEMVKVGDDFERGRKVALPDKANLYNFQWIPSMNDGEPMMAMIVPGKERLRMHTSSMARVAESDASYSGANVGIMQDQSLPDLGKDDLLINSKYYIPMPMIPTDLDNDGRYELLVNKPISVSAQFFDRYRFYPQGEIHSLYWDGVGTSLMWKTRRIKGSVVAYDVTDVNNDGIRDLVVCINTHPGAVGFSKRKTLVLAYPLDLEKSSSDTAVHKDFKEEE